MLDPEEYPWQAICVDRAVNLLGSNVMADLQAVEGKTAKERENKQARVMARYFPSTNGPKYRDPAAARA